jgi:hypothetical protein
MVRILARHSSPHTASSHLCDDGHIRAVGIVQELPHELQVPS